ncbi:FecR domain-containing protein [Aliifodinibius sp. S!AR15-10]|nr:FecR domain-containing protein [Aliifodinibius sp. S!AR15-10]
MASREEAKKWDDWIKKSPHHKKIAREAQEVVMGMDFKSPSSGDKQVAWDELEERFERNEKRTEQHAHTDWWYKHGELIMKVAAVVLIFAATAVATFFVYSDYNPPVDEKISFETKSIETSFRQQKTLSLSDGSIIQLNANSSLTYAPGGEVVEVFLEGEAYFSIASRKSPYASPFSVRTNDGTVEVMGTKFVVNTDSYETRVALEEGAVTVHEKRGATKKIRPNELANFSQERNSIEIEPIENIEVFTSWTQSKLVLDSSPLSYLVKRLEDTYGVDVVVSDDSFYDRKLTGTIELRDLDYVIQALSEVVEGELFISDETVYLGKQMHSSNEE